MDSMNCLFGVKRQYFLSFFEKTTTLPNPYRDSIYCTMIQYGKLAYRKCKALSLDTIKTYHNTVLL